MTRPTLLPARTPPSARSPATRRASPCESIYARGGAGGLAWLSRSRRGAGEHRPRSRRGTPKAPVEDVLIQTLVTISSIGYQPPGTDRDHPRHPRSRAQRLAIETMRAAHAVLGSSSRRSSSATSTSRREPPACVRERRGTGRRGGRRRRDRRGRQQPDLTAPRAGGIVIRMPAVATWLETEHCALSGGPGRSTL